MNLTRCPKATSAAVLCLGTLLALPASGVAADAGGTAAAGSGGTVVPPAGSPALQASQVALLGRRQKVVGQIGGGAAGGAVLLQRSDAGAGWVTVARSQATIAGTFTAIWKTDRSGRFTLRAVPAGSGTASAAVVAPTAPVTVYRSAIATEYGPSSGRRTEQTACGVVLTRKTLGVANRTLPCGTLVEVYYRGRTLSMPVIDRGPYANNADWDLTYAAARAVRFNGLDQIGTVRTGSVSLARRR